MAYTTIDDGSAHFQTTLYTGNGSNGRAITNTGNSDLQPDWLWIKSRSSGSLAHRLYDSSRGTSVDLRTHGQNADTAESNALASFDSDGFTIGSAADVNTNSATFVAWQWKANCGTTSTNNDGSTASTVQANTTAGFSIVTFSRSAGGTITVGHGLGKKPDWIIVKSRQTSNNWVVTHKSLGTEMQDYYLILNGTDASSNSNDIFGGEPTSSVFSTTNNVASNDNQIAYCFTGIKGYSKFGSYIGNGNADGAFVYMGFKPAFILIKRNASESWVIADTTRDPFNKTTAEEYILANSSGAAAAGLQYDFLSNGIKFRGTSQNENSATYYYIAFAEHPFVSSKGVPVTAR